MFKLVLHHDYRKVVAAIDISGADNHGHPNDVTVTPGDEPSGKGALNFAMPTSRISLKTKPMFTRLHALKIEMTARIGSLGQRRNLVEGDNSFAFFVHPNGVLAGTALSRLSAGGPLGWYGADSHMNSPSGGATVPANKWVKLTYIHDGFASIRLFIDDKLVAVNSSLHSSLRPVGSRGIHIGNWPAGNAYTFKGDIDEVRLWKWEPDSGYHHFFCQPPSCCWGDVFGAMGAWARGPDGRTRLQALLQCVGTVQTEIIRAVRRQDEATLREITKLSQRYHRLWCRRYGKDSDAEDLLKAWLEMIERIVGRDRLRELLNQMIACLNEHGLMEAMPKKLDFEKCDPGYVGFIQILMRMMRD
jgi:hypothetical protein